MARYYPVCLSAENTILERHDSVFKDMFPEMVTKEFKVEFDKLGVTCKQRPINNMTKNLASVIGKVQM